jgi:hypothetical protein
MAEFNHFIQKVIDDLPPGGLPENLTEVKAPGPLCGAA